MNTVLPSGFAALVSDVVVDLSQPQVGGTEVLMIPPTRLLRSPWLPWVLLWMAMGLFGVGFAILSIAVDRAFRTGRFDLGNMVQAVWSSAHGHPLAVTNLQGHEVSRLASHFDPILVLFAPLWRLWPSADMLLAAQAIGVALGALPVYWLALKHTRSAVTGVVFALAYLLYPATGWLVLNEFHPVAFACPLLLYAFWYLDQDRLVPFWAFALLAMTTKEEVGLVVASYGLWYALTRRRWLAGAVVSTGGALVAALAVYAVIPHFNTLSSSFFNRYAVIGSSPAEIVRTIVLHPIRIAQTVITARNLTYLGQLVLPLAALPLLSPVVLVVLPELALNMLSADAFQSSIRFHYTAAEIPPLMVAAVLGAGRLVERRASLAKVLPLVVLGASVIGSYHVGPVLFWRAVPGAAGELDQAISISRHDRITAAALKMIPSDGSVSATNSLGAHLSARREIFSFPVVRDARWIAVDEKLLSYQDRFAPLPAAVRLVGIRTNAGWRLVFERDGILIFRRVRSEVALLRGAAASRLPPVRDVGLAELPRTGTSTRRVPATRAAGRVRSRRSRSSRRVRRPAVP